MELSPMSRPGPPMSFLSVYGLTTIGVYPKLKLIFSHIHGLISLYSFHSSGFFVFSHVVDLTISLRAAALLMNNSFRLTSCAPSQFNVETLNLQE